MFAVEGKAIPASLVAGDKPSGMQIKRFACASKELALERGMWKTIPWTMYKSVTRAAETELE